MGRVDGRGKGGNAPAGIGLNSRLGGACSTDDQTGSDTMSRFAKHYHVFETALGFCAIAWSDAGVARFQLPTKSAEAADRLMRRRVPGAEPGAPPEDVAAVVAAAKRYFDGEETDFSHVRLDLAGARRLLHPDLRRPAAGRLGPHDHLWRVGEGGRRRPRGGARRRRSDGQKSGAVDHSLSPGPGRRRQDRRLLRARRLEDEGAHARTGGRSHRAGNEAGAAIFRFLSRD